MTRQSNIYSTKQRKEFKKFALIKNARDMVTEEIVYNMFPPAEMKTLDEEIELSSFSVHDYVATHLKQVFLPWPLSLLHLLPDWMILSGLVIIGLILIKIFLDPCMAICHLLRDSSLTITEKIPHRNRSQVQVSLKVTAQIHHLNITVMLDFFLMFDTFSIDQSPEIAGKLNNHVLDYK